MTALQAGILYLDIIATIAIFIAIYLAWLKYQQLKVEGKL